jgi:hypothetical protein
VGEIYDYLGEDHPRPRPELHACGLKALPTVLRVIPQPISHPHERRSFAVELGRSRCLFTPQASVAMTTPRLLNMSETVSRLMANASSDCCTV